MHIGKFGSGLHPTPQALCREGYKQGALATTPALPLHNQPRTLHGLFKCSVSISVAIMLGEWAKLDISKVSSDFQN